MKIVSWGIALLQAGICVIVVAALVWTIVGGMLAVAAPLAVVCLVVLIALFVLADLGL